MIRTPSRKTRRPRRGWTFVVAALTALTTAGPALAGDPTAPPKTIDTTVTPKPGDPTAAAKPGDLAASPKPDDPARPSPVTAEALRHAAEATEQATRFRAAGDEGHAKAADGLAREWSETARDLGLAAAAEKLADERKRLSMQAQAKLERTRALVEEGIARLGRLRAELEAGPSKSTVAVESHDGQPGRAAAGKPKIAATGSTP
jgi:hypothetical protein